MGRNIVVDKIAYKNAENRLMIQGHAQNTDRPQSELQINSAQWYQWIDTEGAPFHATLQQGLLAIKRNNANYQERSHAKTLELGFTSVTAYKIEDALTHATVTYRHNGSDPTCDGVTVNMLDAAGKTFTLQIAIENGVATFVRQALATFDAAPIAPTQPVITKAPIRTPVLSSVAHDSVASR